METKMTPKDFFLHLGIITTLYVSIVALISFLFEVINVSLPDVNDYYYSGQNSSLAWSMSIFIIVYPVLVYLLFKTSKYFSQYPEKAGLAIKKWFTYLTIFLTSLTVVIDLIVLLNTFLQGEQLTLRFILKVLVVVVIALTVFWISLKDLNGGFLSNLNTLKKTIIGVSVFVLILIVTGFAFIGSPQKAREINEDRVRVDNLRYIQDEVVRYWDLKKALPQNLSELNDPLNYVVIPTDPETNAEYEYKALSPTSFEICANFKTADSGDETYAKYDTTYQYFKHSVGKTCFERTIDVEKRQNILKPVAI